MLRLLFTAVVASLLSTLVSAETLSVSGDDAYPPSSWSYQGQLFGVGPTLVQAALRERGIQAKFEPELPWKRALRMLEQGELDIMTSVYRTVEREQRMRFVPEPYLEDKIVVWIKQQPRPALSSLDQLKDKQGIMIIGYSGGEHFDRWAKQQQLNIQRISSITQCLAMLLAGRADYLIFSQQVGEAWIERLHYTGQLTPLADPIAIEPLFIAIANKPEYVEISEYLNHKIGDYKGNGQIALWLRQALDRFRQQHRSTP